MQDEHQRKAFEYFQSSGHEAVIRQLEYVRTHERAFFEMTAAMRAAEMAARATCVGTRALFENRQMRNVEHLFADARMRQLADRITAPWADCNGLARSVDSLRALDGMSRILRCQPFGESECVAMRLALGDWRQVTVPGLTDWEQRTAFYIEHGFDQRLTALPEPAFTQTLDIVLHRRRGRRQSPIIDDDVDGAVDRRMRESSEVVVRFERRVRDFVLQVMTSRYGDRWMKQRVPPAVLERWRAKRADEEDKSRSRETIFEYADFVDYLEIILRRDNWSDLFEGIFGDKEEISVSFRRLYPLRNEICHACRITKEDYLVLLLETRRIERAINRVAKQL
jgi:hypothetical protein